MEKVECKIQHPVIEEVCVICPYIVRWRNRELGRRKHGCSLSWLGSHEGK